MKLGVGTRLAKLGVNRRMVKIYIATFISYMSNGYSVTMVYPFLSATTKFFLPNEDTATINTYAGFIVAAFFAGRTVGSYIWGSLADRYGRKPVLTASVVLMAACTLVLAFSVNYGMTVAFRVLLGLSNGVLVILRAVVSESSTDTNQTYGFSMLTCSWLLAAVSAPLLSGLTADPINQYNLTLSDGAVKSFLTRFPYSPPYLLNTLVCVLGAIAVIFLLPETLDKKSKKILVLSSMDNRFDSRSGDGSTSELTTMNGDDHEPTLSPDGPDHEGPPAHVLGTDTDQSQLISGGLSDEPNAKVLQSSGFNADKHKTRCCSIVIGCAGIKHWLASLKSILWNRTTLLIFSAHSLFAIYDTGIDSLIALWCATPLSLGGLGFTVSDIGITSTVVSAICWPFNLFSYPLLARRFGSIQTHQMFAILFLVLAVLMPSIHYLAVAGQTAAVWVVLIASRVLLTTSNCTCFAAQCLFIGNSVTNDKLGRINGMAVFISDIFRASSPAISGAIYAASLSQQSISIGFPVDYYLTFVIFSGTALIMVIFVACLPSTINHKSL